MLNPMLTDLYAVITEKKKMPVYPAMKAGVNYVASSSSFVMSIRNMLQNVKAYDENLYADTAWQGSLYKFDNFDFGSTGTGGDEKAPFERYKSYKKFK